MIPLQTFAARPVACAILVGVLFAACSAPSAPDEDGNGNSNTALTVLSVTPANGATGVATGTPVIVTFSADVEPTSVNNSSFVVAGAAGTIQVSAVTATFTPSTPYANGATLMVTVAGVQTRTGSAMASPFTSSFSVVARPATPPKANAGVDRQVTAGAPASLTGSASEGTDATYTWTQLAGPTVGALSGVSPTFTAPNAIARLDFELAVSGSGPTSRDTVSIWVLEDGAHAWFVAKSGNDSNAGTRAAPFSTIARAISAADADGNGGDVYVAAGTYTESVVLKSRVSVYGGFDAEWRRNVTTSRPVIDGGRIAVSASDANNLTLDGVFIRAATATEAARSSIALLLHNSQDVRIVASRVQAGNGAAGIAGGDGADRVKATNGSNGSNAGTCTPPRAGGGGGSSSISRAGGDGGNGGLGGGFDGDDGQGGSGGNGGNGGGAFGGNASKGSGSGSSGADGAGGDGDGGVGVLSATGIELRFAASGSAGGSGWGGGGGGGGGGGLGCGGGGGGGGAGGQGGGGGQGGISGGHSIGIALSGTSSVTVGGSEVLLGNGGRGGNGGAGGDGGAGGSRGSGGNNSVNGGAGGDGADGTRGGEGGGGGGGAGGWSIAILESANAVSARQNVSITHGTPGPGGTGGPRASGNPGRTGVAGSTADVHKLP